MKKSEIFFGALRVPFDAIFTFLSFLIAYQIRSRTDLIPWIQFPVDLGVFMPLSKYAIFAIFASLFFVIILAINHSYSLKVSTKVSGELLKVFINSLIWLALIIAYFFFTRKIFFSRLVLAYSWMLTIILVSFGRILIRYIHLTLLNKNIGKRKILFLGINSITKKIFEEIKSNPRYAVIGVIETEMHKEDLPFKFLGTTDQLKYIMKKNFIDEIIQTKQDLTDAQTQYVLSLCREHHIQYSFVPDELEVQFTNVELSQIASLPIISLKSTSLDGWGKVLKRLFDLTGSMLLLIITSPVMILTSIAIKIEDPKGTIFFKYLDNGGLAKRVGERGKFFYCFKFRTMKMNTHNMRYKELAEQNARKDSPLVKIPNDPRITRLGSLLRKFSIDELPQLINVIKGEMSLVGPRPHLPEEVANYKKHHRFVLTLRPGITGMAQTHGRSKLDFEQEVKLDTYYIEHWSLWLDIKILIRTFFVVISGQAE